MVTGGVETVRLGEALEALYERYDSRDHVDPDPLVFLYDYPDTCDREIAGLVASSLAFGSVGQIMASVRGVLAPMGRSPREFIMNTTPRRLEAVFDGFRHRWATGRDLASMLLGAGAIIEEHGSLEAGFVSWMDGEDVDVVPAMTRLARELLRHGDGAGRCLVPDPSRGSACKRLNLFLRWMVRSDNVDPGGWDGVPASKLLVPLDTHMFRFASLMGLTARSRADLAAAREITRSFAAVSPADPVKYDFALTRLGIRRDDDRGELMARLGIGPGAEGMET